MEFKIYVSYFEFISEANVARDGSVVEGLRCKLVGRGIYSRWCQNFSLT
jgi:hypothetical protein